MEIVSKEMKKPNLTEKEKDEFYKKLHAGLGSMKGKFTLTDEEAREMAWKETAKKLGLNSD